jgi:hypothetical protein
MSSMTMSGQLLDPRLRKVYRRRAAGVIYETYLVE